ncbi:hypothetical protein [Mycobacterium gordonae]|uniref:hypothetical protein n=1 Tax=Mycobacterium gordonae TaxID=1778 RepID=UPI000AA61C17|nr:hypothetical protein [Mycobacterium gordonae]
MRLVLTQNEVSLSDIEYGDVLGKVYEYPSRYRTLIQPGERFVYYRGRRRADGSSQTPSYLGYGTIGVITHIGDRLRCTIEDYQAFKKPLPFKDGDRYREPEANHRKAIGFYFQVGVRSIDQNSFDEIVSAGLGDAPRKMVALKRATTTSAQPKPEKKVRDDQAYELALTLAKQEAKSEWPSAKVFQAPSGQYFSLIVKQQNGDSHHIAVKATDASEPRVRLTEGEISYADAHAKTYSLWVFYAVDLEAGIATLIKRKGRITEDDIDLRSAIHGGRLRNTTTGKKIGPIPR